jgi:hypothetical protein
MSTFTTNQERAQQHFHSAVVGAKGSTFVIQFPYATYLPPIDTYEIELEPIAPTDPGKTNKESTKDN